jgi:hypothetical protein
MRSCKTLRRRDLARAIAVAVLSAAFAAAGGGSACAQGMMGRSGGSSYSGGHSGGYGGHGGGHGIGGIGSAVGLGLAIGGALIQQQQEMHREQAAHPERDRSRRAEREEESRRSRHHEEKSERAKEEERSKPEKKEAERPRQEKEAKQPPEQTNPPPGSYGSSSSGSSSKAPPQRSNWRVAFAGAILGILSQPVFAICPSSCSIQDGIELCPVHLKASGDFEVYGRGCTQDHQAAAEPKKEPEHEINCEERPDLKQYEGDLRVHAQMSKAWSESHPNGACRTKQSCEKREVAFWIIKNDKNELSTSMHICGKLGEAELTLKQLAALSPPPGWQIVAFFHTHPFVKGDMGEPGYDPYHPSSNDSKAFNVPGMIQHPSGICGYSTEPPFLYKVPNSESPNAPMPIDVGCNTPFVPVPEVSEAPANTNQPGRPKFPARPD